MVKRKGKKEKFEKIVSEQFPVNSKKGGGIIKIEAWQNKNGEIVKYSMAYINHLLWRNFRGIRFYNISRFSG